MPEVPDPGAPSRGRPVLLVLRRAGTQAQLLGSVAAVVLVGSLVLGLCAALLTTGQDQALVAAVRAAGPDAVTARVGVRLAEGATGPAEAAQAAADLTAATEAAYASFPTATSTWAASTPLYLPGGRSEGVRRAYLLEGDDLSDHADLVTGRWPSGAPSDAAVEVAVLDVAADLLGLSAGSTLLLEYAPPRTGTEAGDGVQVTVVGTFAPARGEQVTWDRDPLDGAGYSPSVDGPPLFGPFVVPSGALLGRFPVERLSLVVEPDLATVDAATAISTRTDVAGLRGSFEESLGERLRALALHSPYPRTVDEIRNQQGVVASGILVAALLAAALAAAALGLASALVVLRRAPESDLFAARGATGRRLAGHAIGEALVLAAVVTAVGVPLGLTVVRAAARLPHLAAAGVEASAAPTPALVVTVAGAALLLAGVLVVPALRAAHAPSDRGRTDRRGVVARAGVDLVLLALAVLGYLRLRAHGIATGAAPDPVLVAAPVLCLVAGAVLALRVLPGVAGVAERWAAGSRHLVVPMAAWELARRRHSTTGAFLLVLATATAVFGLTFQGTWTRSQVDQAEARVGADLVVTPTGVPPLAHGAALAAATGGTPAAVTHRPVSLGSRTGSDATGEATQLVATDLGGPGLRLGRPPDGSTWDEVTAPLVTAPTAGPLLEAGRTVRLRVVGTVKEDEPLLAAPALVLQDPYGDQAVVVGDAVPLDGRPHDVELPLPGGSDDLAPADGIRVVAMDLTITLAGQPTSSAADLTSRVTVQTEILGASAGSGTDVWSGARRTNEWEVVRSVEAGQAADGEGVTVTSAATVSLTGLQWETGHLVVIAGDPVAEVPVALTEGLAADLALGQGGQLSVTVGRTQVDAVVAAVVPYLPSEASGAAVLMDRTTLSRALLGGRDLSPLTDEWWVDGPTDPLRAATAVSEAHLGTPVTADGVAARLRGGPLPAMFWTATWLLIATAGVLALAGTAAQTAAAVGARAVEVARLLGLGLSRRAVLGSLLVQHAALCLVAVLSGALVGAVVAWATGPLLVVSEAGTRPVPGALVVWPVAALVVALTVLFVGSTAVVVPVAAGAVRRAGAAHLRMDDAP